MCTDEKQDVLNRLYTDDGNESTVLLEYAAYMN